MNDNINSDERTLTEAQNQPKASVDITPVAEACSNAVNGPNGLEFCKTVSSVAKCIGAVFAYAMLLKTFEST